MAVFHRVAIYINPPPVVLSNELSPICAWFSLALFLFYSGLSLAQAVPTFPVLSLVVTTAVTIKIKK